ncbi:MAG: aminotransferase class III-fold pyridoxal phosphate-dependent enzyme, partial [Gemmiger sp.]
TLVNSFHGRTLATLKATGQEVFHHDFGPFPENFAYVPANDFAALAAAVDDATCAVMMEMVQGEGGVVALDAAYVHQVAELCAAKDILLIVDEVQTGVGRTGTFLACQHFGLKPDIVSLAKGLGGGLPIGAVLATDRVAACMTPGSHGSTFGGNPVACAGGCAVLDVMDDAFMENVNARAAQLRAGLAALPHVTDVSGLGLMVGIAFEEGIQAADVRAACERQGLLVLTAKTRLRLLPPLILTEADVNAALETLRGVLAAL